MHGQRDLLDWQVKIKEGMEEERPAGISKQMERRCLEW